MTSFWPARQSLFTSLCKLDYHLLQTLQVIFKTHYFHIIRVLKFEAILVELKCFSRIKENLN